MYYFELLNYLKLFKLGSVIFNHFPNYLISIQRIIINVFSYQIFYTLKKIIKSLKFVIMCTCFPKIKVEKYSLK